MTFAGITRAAALAAAVVVLGVAPSAGLAKGAHLSDAAIKQRMIKESIASYPGNCPRPYNAARNGSSCGGRSAWSRAGGYAPLCYASDISKQAVDSYRRANGL